MKARVTKQFTVRGRTYQPGEIMEASEAVLAKLSGAVEPITMAGKEGSVTEPVQPTPPDQPDQTAEIWRQFTAEAAAAYQLHKPSQAVWDRHNELKKQAQACTDPADVFELLKEALGILSDPALSTGSPEVSPDMELYCPSYGGHCSNLLTDNPCTMTSCGYHGKPAYVSPNAGRRTISHRAANNVKI